MYLIFIFSSGEEFYLLISRIHKIENNDLILKKAITHSRKILSRNLISTSVKALFPVKSSKR